MALLPIPLDLHVLSLPLAFILSQDQTLRCIYKKLNIFRPVSRYLSEINKVGTPCFFFIFIFSYSYFMLQNVNELPIKNRQPCKTKMPAIMSVCFPAPSLRGLSRPSFFPYGAAKVTTFFFPPKILSVFFFFLLPCHILSSIQIENKTRQQKPSQKPNELRP